LALPGILRAAPCPFFLDTIIREPIRFVTINKTRLPLLGETLCCPAGTLNISIQKRASVC
jgi:hypothetical protein